MKKRVAFLLDSDEPWQAEVLAVKEQKITTHRTVEVTPNGVRVWYKNKVQVRTTVIATRYDKSNQHPGKPIVVAKRETTLTNEQIMLLRAEAEREYKEQQEMQRDAYKLLSQQQRRRKLEYVARTKRRVFNLYN